ncbi:MAG: DUF4388 domain-containing protein [Deltaproteobacteria bacterium]|nr:MAG: DUF4388 domain-containing protein [Deltaproteobacteria bacterium]
MSFSGNIEDVSVADTLQFIHLGGRSGTLRLVSGDAQAEIGFHHGRIVKAWGPSSKRLGEILLETGVIGKDTLETALRSQEGAHPRPTLGQILVTMGALDAESIYKVLEQQILGTVRDLVTWNRGTFEFALDDLRPADEMAVYPGDVVNLNVDTQMVLLDALRLFDERNRATKPLEGDTQPVHPSPAPKLALPELPRPPVVPAMADPAPPPPRLQVVSPDPKMTERLTQLLKPSEANIVRVTLREAGTPPPGEPSPIVLLDLRQGGVALEAVATVRRSRPRASVIAVVDASTSAAAVYEAGALAAVEGKPAVIAACIRSAVQNRRDLWSGSAMRPERIKENFARLRRIVGDLRSGLISTTISLSLMNIISESVERAVLFLVRRTDLAVLGAFGTGKGGQPLALLTRGLRLPLNSNNALVASLGDGQVRSVAFEESLFPPEFVDLIGKPSSGQCAIFPVLGGQKVIAVVYADNGFSNTAIEQVEMLELAAVQAGLALENELLRRQVGQARAEPPATGSTG